MKTYYLRLTSDDFTNAISEDPKNKSWVTGVIDLYDNASDESELATPSYTNYSTTKSPGYGTNLLGDNTWTGLNDEVDGTDIVTSTGIVRDGRYIDLSGRIDILEYRLELEPGDYDADVVPVLSVYTAPEHDAVWDDEWTIKENIPENRSIVVFGANRFAKFKLDFETDVDDISDLQLDMYVRININSPVQTPFYTNSRTVIDKFPEWMAMREYEVEPQFTGSQITSQPDSLGGKFLNAVAGEWLNEIGRDINYNSLQQFIGTTDLRQTAWVYVCSNVPEYVYRVEFDSVELSHTGSLREFYEQSETDKGFWWDREKRAIYVKEQYEPITINGEEYDLTPQHVWNWFDEFGLQLDLERHYLEDNETYKKRILDIHANRPGVGVEAFKLTLRRELNLWLTQGATPSSDYLGATPEVLEIKDIEQDPDFFTSDGMPTEKMANLVEELALSYPTTWGFFKWNKAFWDIGGVAQRSDDYGKGYDVLPYRYDTDQLDESKVQSGVGFGNDLYIYRPDEITGPREFNAKLKIRGRHLDVRGEYPEVRVLGHVYGEADRLFYENPTLTPWISFAFFDHEDNFYYTLLQPNVKSNIDIGIPVSTEDGDTTIDIFSEGRTDPGLIWYDVDGLVEAEDPTVPLTFSHEDIATSYFILGKYGISGGLPAITDIPTDDIDMWIASRPGEVVNMSSATPMTYLTLNEGEHPIVMLRSHEDYSYVGRWQSDRQPFELTINGAAPGDQLQDFTMSVPYIAWNPELEATPNKKYIVELNSSDLENGSFGAWTKDAGGNTVFLDDTHILVNGSDTWDAEGKQELDDDITSIVWSTGTSADYPIQAPVWSLFEADADTVIYGVVDENGPWRNGVPSPPGNTNFNLTPINISRSDFGIPEQEEYVPTWIGVEVDNDRVVTWVDSNVVNPYSDESSISIVYPDNAINELYNEDDSSYYYSQFILRARIRPGASPEWHPSMNSGYFYDRLDEHYAYVDPITETATVNDFTLEDVARQGAPIIVHTNESTPRAYRQVAFHDATVIGEEEIDILSLVNEEIVWGTGTNRLYLAYEDIYDIEVTDLNTNEILSADVNTSTNEVTTLDDTSWDREYKVTYKVNYSFIADHEFISEDGTQRTKLSFLSESEPSSATPATITYETSRFDPATPIDIPLNTFYTSMAEGYIFISHNEYDLSTVNVSISPSKIVADGQDHMLITLRSLDVYENPKPNQNFTLTTTFGQFESASPANTISLSTDRDGFAVAVLISELSTDYSSGTITITGEVSESIDFEIDPISSPSYRLTAVPTSDSVIADGKSYIGIYGIVETDEYEPVANAPVYYRKARNMYEAFALTHGVSDVSSDSGGWPDTGMVYADSEGRFSIGPFISSDSEDSGYWFVAVESWDETYDEIGDVVAWYEYPDTTFGVNPYNNLPIQPTQHATPWYTIPQQSDLIAFPSTYDDATPDAEATPVTKNWSPPKWYAIQRFMQYQQGVLGSTRWTVDQDSTPHPSHRDF